jgi:hypothetical protein
MWVYLVLLTVAVAATTIWTSVVPDWMLFPLCFLGNALIVTAYPRLGLTKWQITAAVGFFLALGLYATWIVMPR